MTTELKNKLIAQALVGLSQVAFPLVTYPIITHALYAEGLGEVNFADSIVQTLLILASLGIPLYGVREIAKRRNDPSETGKLFSELVILQALVCIPAVALVWLIGSFSGVNTDLLLTGSIALVASSLGGEWFLQAHESFLFIAIRTLLVRIMMFLLILFLVKGPGDGVIYYAILMSGVVITSVLNWLTIGKMAGKAAVSLQPLRHLKKVNWIYACYVLASLYTVSDTLLLGWLKDEVAVGHYSFAYRLIRMSAMLIPTLGVVFIPRIARHHEEDNDDELRGQVAVSQGLIYFFCIPMSLLFFVMAPEIIAVLANDDFLPSVAVLRILSLVPLLTGLSHLAGTQILVSVHREKVFFLFLVIGMIIDLVCNVLLIPLFTERGAAFSNLMTESFVATGSLVYLGRKGFFHFTSGPFFQALLASLFLLPVVYFLRKTQLSPLLLLVLSITITGIFYLGFHYVVKKTTSKNVATTAN